MYKRQAAAVLLAAAVVATSMAPAFAKEKAPEGELRFREDGSFTTVSYTHLDVYKRQLFY